MRELATHADGPTGGVAMRKLIGLVLALGAMFAAVPASATMTYTILASFSGKLTTHLSTTPVVRTFNDVDFLFTGISDGSAPTLDSGLSGILGANVYSYKLADLVVLNGGGYDVFGGFSFVVAPTENLIGFTSRQGLLFAVKLPTSYDGTSFYYGTDFIDTGASHAITVGNRKFKFTNVSDDTPGATFLAFDAVPETATWAMFIVGFGAVGSGMRRRNLLRAFAA
jgi:hypothetical protein